jgi:hypothetical protein
VTALESSTPEMDVGALIDALRHVPHGPEELWRIHINEPTTKFLNT